MARLILIINEDKFFLSHRREIAAEALRHGWEVTLVAKDTGHRREIEALGLKFVNLPVNPTGMSPAGEWKTFRFLLSFLKRNRDSVVHFVGLKNMLWGGLASKIVRPGARVFAVSGLGTLFGENRSKFLTWGLLRTMRTVLKGPKTTVIFQNPDDRDLFLSHGAVRKNDIRFIKGSGVDLNEFKPAAPPAGPLKVIFTGRMIAEKGVTDLIQAARLLQQEFGGKVEFILCGGTSDNPSALDPESLKAMTSPPYIQWLGHRTDVATLLNKSHIICFPSYYREGVPKSLLEASACGLPIVTCDSVGCRETVEEGVNGFLVPPHRPDLLAEALGRLLRDPELRLRMGQASRRKAEKEYDVKAVTAVHMEIYRSLAERSADK